MMSNVTPSRLRPTVEWQVAGACNYDCSYCIQSRRYRKGRPDSVQMDSALRAFAALPGTWEIKCSGGEAFAHPLFMSQIVPGLMEQTPHHISVLTNLSATRPELMRFAALTRGRLRVFSASLHLEFTALQDFIDKATWLVDQLDLDVDFVVNQVVFPGQEAQAAACRDAIEAVGLRWFPQLYKVNGGVAEFGPELERLIGARPANRAPNFQGLRCWAGVHYFAVDKDGRAWSCRSAKREKQGLLGNIFDGSFERWTQSRACPYTICPCTVPRNRGMIEGAA